MMFLHPRVNERFEFTDGGEETIAGRVLRKAIYREVARPTLIKTTRGRDLALTGTIWIDPFTGTVVKTEMNAADPTVRCQVTVTFRRDEALDMWVPEKMEEYDKADSWPWTTSSRPPPTPTSASIVGATWNDETRYDGSNDSTSSRGQARLVPCIGCAASLSANDWPHWRGPSATGVAAPSPLPSTWSATENVAWQAPLEGAGVSSPIVSGNRVFVTSQVGDGRRRDGRHPTLTQGVDPTTAGEATLSRRARADVAFVVEAFDRSTGKRLWIHETAAEGELPPVHDKHNLSSASPVTDGERVYAWFGTGQLVALDMTRQAGVVEEPCEGVRRLRHSVGPRQLAGAVPGQRSSCSAITPRSSYLLALDKRTGAVKWKVDKAAGHRVVQLADRRAGAGRPRADRQFERRRRIVRSGDRQVAVDLSGSESLPDSRCRWSTTACST